MGMGRVIQFAVVKPFRIEDAPDQNQGRPGDAGCFHLGPDIAQCALDKGLIGPADAIRDHDWTVRAIMGR